MLANGPRQTDPSNVHLYLQTRRYPTFTELGRRLIARQKFLCDAQMACFYIYLFQFISNVEGNQIYSTKLLSLQIYSNIILTTHHNEGRIRIDSPEPTRPSYCSAYSSWCAVLLHSNAGPY